MYGCVAGRAATLLFFCLYVTVLFSHRQAVGGA
jgi:hypothetical protein